MMFVKTAQALILAPTYDILFIQRTTFPFGLEKLLKFSNKNIIFDFDDAIYLADERYLTRFQNIIKLSDHIITSNNNIGIGTSNPAYPLDVVGDINFTGTFRQNGTAYIGSQWSNSGANVFLISSNVGLGLSNPGFTLDVNGSINASNSFTALPTTFTQCNVLPTTFGLSNTLLFNSLQQCYYNEF